MSIDLRDMMTRLNGEAYEGGIEDGFPNGKGVYVFSSGILYNGQLMEGMFDGEGTLTFPQGGQFKAKWKQGHLDNGTYFYDDELKYSTEDWVYCTDADRRFWTGIQRGIALADEPQLTDKSPPMWIPASSFDVGDGYYDPLDNNVYSYDGVLLRPASKEEATWAVRKCRIGVPDEEADIKPEEDNDDFVENNSDDIVFEYDLPAPIEEEKYDEEDEDGSEWETDYEGDEGDEEYAGPSRPVSSITTVAEDFAHNVIRDAGGGSVDNTARPLSTATAVGRELVGDVFDDLERQRERAAIKIQALERGRQGRRKARRRRKQAKPPEEDLTEEELAEQAAAAVKIQAAARGRQGRNKAIKKREQASARDREQAAAKEVLEI